MYYILSKFLSYLLSPILWVFILLAIAALTKNIVYKKRFFISAIILLILFSNPFLLNRFAKFWDFPPNTISKSSHYSCVIVLGGFGAEDNQGNGYFNSLADRFIQGIKLRERGNVSHILITGGNSDLHPSQYNQADWVATQLKEFNFPDSCIIEARNSRNTYEDAIFSKELLKNNHLQPPYLLVTSAFHMRRSLFIFKKIGLAVIPVPCNFFAGRNRETIASLLPNAGALSAWEIYIKEMIGLAVYYIRSSI
jgi:uncharacterized SAM-binding protein YcdF (DUF218 family)